MQATDPVLTMPAATPVEAESGNLPGIDLNVALAATRGSRERLYRLLRLFAERHAGDADALATLLAADDRDAAVRLAHALKGASGTLGINRVYELASQANAQLRGNTPCAEVAATAAEIAAALKLVCGTIDKLPPA